MYDCNLCVCHALVGQCYELMNLLKSTKVQTLGAVCSKVQRLISRDPEDIGTHTQTHKNIVLKKDDQFQIQLCEKSRWIEPTLLLNRAQSRHQEDVSGRIESVTPLAETSFKIVTYSR